MAVINTQFSIAIHLLAGLGFRPGQEVTSNDLARSINTSPSFVRRILAKLSKAGLVKTTQGKTGGCLLGKPAKDITLLAIYRAVGAPQTFSIHTYPTQKTCPVSCHIKSSMEGVLYKAQKSFEAGLSKISLAAIVSDLRRQ